MNSFKKMIQKFNDDQKVSFKHSKSMPFSSEGRKREPPHDDPFQHAYRGKTPLQNSDIEHAYYYHGPTRAKVNTHTDSDLLAKFPHSPEPTEGLPRSGFRALSLNSQSIKPQIPSHNLGTSSQQAYPSIPRTKQRHEATLNQASADVPLTSHDHDARSGRLAERIRAKSSAARSNIPLPPAPAPAYPQSCWPYSQYDEISREQDPTVLRGMINRYPLAPVCRERYPEHTRPIYLDMNERRSPQQTLQWYIRMAFSERRPLDVRAGGRYHRVVDISNMGIA
ncbi:hypothetical protein BDR07DRAFT_1613243 [Suillus spraguei]|nr:hypothetical protein BDR07DRAFT_1613243 [Suillus spraguei]